jgi:tetratricopeptide (TPR) repeat protein
MDLRMNFGCSVKILVVRILILVIWFLPIIANAGNYGSMAREAFYRIEADPFNSSVVENAAHKIKTAFDGDPKNPWVLIAVSRLMLEKGYIKGDRSKKSTYSLGTVENAGIYAEEALKYGSDIGMAHIQYSKIQIINGDLKGAWLTLNKAYEKDPQDFYPWYYRAVISVRMRDFKRAGSLLNEAEARATSFYQRSWVAGRRISVAKLIGDESGIEDAYKKSIEIDPTSPHRYGNYAHYLKRKKRYKEAIVYYEKAISISPYPIALKGLQESKRLLNNGGD